MKCSVAGIFAIIVARSTLASPVERVVTLLKDLQDKLESDEQSEQQTYDKYACWCDETSAQKAADITKAQNELRALGQTILSLKGLIATRTSEIETLQNQISSIDKATEQLTVLRQKGNAEFAAETTELKQALATLQEAIAVLEEGSTSLLQSSTSEATSAALKAVIRAMPTRVSLQPSQLEQLSAFVQSGSKFTPQSLTVQGILSDLYNTFAADLEVATAGEAKANRDFEDIMDVKATEKAQATETKSVKEEEKASAESRLADTQQIYDDTSAQKDADVKFFDATKQSCLAKHDAWTTRSDLRDEEVRGVKEALEILTGDGSRELFAKTIKAGKEVGMDDKYDTGVDITAFLQIRNSDAEAAAGARAYSALKRGATEAHSLRVAALAARVRLAKAGHFDEVIVAIDNMMKTLHEEDANDLAKFHQCKDEYQKNTLKLENAAWLIQKNEATIHKLENLIQVRTEQKLQTIADIQEVDSNKQVLTQQREQENLAFTTSKADDQEAITILNSAREALTAYYKNHSVNFGPIQGSVKGLELVQQPDFDVSADQAPEATLSGAGVRKHETKGIVQIMTMLIEDLNDEIKNDMKTEETAQVEYDKQIAAANALRKDLVDKRTSLADAIAKRGLEKTAEEEDKDDNERDQQAEIDYKASIKDDCDFIIRTFTKRAAAREAEMQGLSGAKEYLVGSNPPNVGLVQRLKPFSDQSHPNTRFLGIEN